jgi:hypothetical protein
VNGIAQQGAKVAYQGCHALAKNGGHLLERERRFPVLSYDASKQSGCLICFCAIRQLGLVSREDLLRRPSDVLSKNRTDTGSGG